MPEAVDTLIGGIILESVAIAGPYAKVIVPEELNT
jgi:hypothetical protein